MKGSFRASCNKSCLSGHDNISVLAHHAAINEELSMNNECAQEIAMLIERFVSGIDISIAAANRLEVLLDELFPNDELVQDRICSTTTRHHRATPQQRCG